MMSMIFGGDMSFVMYVALALVVYFALRKKNKLPFDKRMNRDLSDLKSRAEQNMNELIPLVNDEFSLLSLNKEEKKDKYQGDEIVTGRYLSIYQEPIFSYSFRKYADSPRHGAVLARTNGDIFYFRIFPKEIDVQINGVEVGKLMDEKLYGTDGRLIANYFPNSIDGTISVVIDNKEICYIQTKDSAHNDVNPRALDMVMEDLSADGGRLMLALVMVQLIQGESFP